MHAPFRPEATLIIRVWFEGDPQSQLRARIVEVRPSHPQERVVGVVATEDGLFETVRAWVEALTPD